MKWTLGDDKTSGMIRYADAEGLKYWEPEKKRFNFVEVIPNWLFSCLKIAVF